MPAHRPRSWRLLGALICLGSAVLSVWMLAAGIQMVRQWQRPINLEAQP